jgi:UvrD/REP helicase N-terminal domain
LKRVCRDEHPDREWCSSSSAYATIPVRSKNGGITMPGSEWQPNPDQQRAIETLSGFCVVMAGPGTGKTDTLAAKTLGSGHL